MSLYSFTGANNPDPTAQAGYNQYIQQGQNMINPGQAAIGQSNPISAAAISGLAQAMKGMGSDQPLPAQLPPDIAQAALQQGAANNPNVNGQNMGGVGPTQQNLALANALQNPSSFQGISY